jgi:hypothetical protein
MKTPEQLSLEDAQKIAEESDYAFAAAGTDDNPINWGDAAAFVLEGYKACFAELTRWNNPYSKIEPSQNVIVKYAAIGRLDTPYYTIGSRHNGVWDCENTLATWAGFEIVGWREIY